MQAYWSFLVRVSSVSSAIAATVGGDGEFIRKVDNSCFLPFPDLFVREGGEQE